MDYTIIFQTEGDASHGTAGLRGSSEREGSADIIVIGDNIVKDRYGNAPSVLALVGAARRQK